MSLDAMKQALHTLEGWANHGEWVWPESALEQAKRNTTESITALRAAIEQAQEPVGWMYVNTDGECEQIEYIENDPMPDDPSVTPLYTAPRQWQGLTQREIDELWDLHHDDYGDALSATGYERAIEAKLREKNT